MAPTTSILGTWKIGDGAMLAIFLRLGPSGVALAACIHTRKRQQICCSLTSSFPNISGRTRAASNPTTSGALSLERLFRVTNTGSREPGQRKLRELERTTSSSSRVAPECSPKGSKSGASSTFQPLCNVLSKCPSYQYQNISGEGGRPPPQYAPSICRQIVV